MTCDWITVSSRSEITPNPAAGPGTSSCAVARAAGAPSVGAGATSSMSAGTNPPPGAGAGRLTHCRTNPSLSACTLATVPPTRTRTSACPTPSLVRRRRLLSALRQRGSPAVAGPSGPPRTTRPSTSTRSAVP